jgi:MFS family permease
MIIAGFAQFLIGPSLLLPNNLWIMVGGQFLEGLFTLYFQVTSLPEMINDVIKKHPNQKYEASDISSGVFNAMLGLGQMLSPLYGSYMTHYFGFRI